MLNNGCLERLPTPQEVGQEMVENANRARRLRSLYKLVVHINRERQSNEQPADNPERETGVANG